jgi:hypothetical protein
MATKQTQLLARTLLTPAVGLLFVWMIVPLALTIYFSTLHYNLLEGDAKQFVGLDNFRYFLTDPAFLASLQNTLVLVGSVLVLTILLGIPFALLLDQPVIGRSIVRLMVIAPFFVMPTVSALIWKNLLMHPVSGLFAWIAKLFGLTPVDWFNDVPLFAIILIVTDPAHRIAVARRGTEGSRRDGRRPCRLDFHLHHATASGAPDHGGHSDRDHLPAHGVCRDLCDHRRRTGAADHQHRLPDLLPGAHSI